MRGLRLLNALGSGCSSGASGLAIQGSVSDVMTFRDGGRHNLATGLGLHLTL